MNYSFGNLGMTDPNVTTQGILNFGQPVTGGPIGAAPVAGPGTPMVPAGAIPPNATAASGPMVPGQVPTQTGLFDKIGGLEGVGTIAKGIASLGQIYSAIQSVKLARDQFDFTKQAYNTNLQNTTKSYNTSLSDRARARYTTEGTPEKAAEYVAENRL